jgi:predicted amidophosphoribosyltransferase
MGLRQSKTTNTGAVERFCKKCGEPLTTTNKHRLCEHCRRESIKKFRNGASVAAMLVVAVVTGGKYIPGKK